MTNPHHTNPVYQNSELFGESGGTHGNSATQALGRPSLDNWELFTRETLQNSWDARDLSSDEDGVTFSIDYKLLSESGSETLRNFFNGHAFGLPNLENLITNRERVPLLLVSDTGTYGLQGVTSAAKTSKMRSDFVSFVRNIGRDSEKELRGGTYGFGKGVLFTMSNVDTILVYSRTFDENGARTNRFIAVSNSNGFSHDELNYTGRHWWGVQAEGLVDRVFVEPFTGREADEYARQFKMDKHFTELRPTGTTVAVIAPRIEMGAESEVMQRIADALTKWAWPHMIGADHLLDPIEFQVSLNGDSIQIPDPRKDPKLNYFVKAYELSLQFPEHTERRDFIEEFQLRGLGSWRDIFSLRAPVEYLGRLAIHLMPREGISKRSVLPDDYHRHVALLRNPRMVVTYLRCPDSGDTEDGYAGVFVASKDLDPIFAASEPPAHDEWNPTTVPIQDERFRIKKTGKIRSTNPVKRALDGIRLAFKKQSSLEVPVVDFQAKGEIQVLSSELGKILSGATGKSTRIGTINSSQVTPKPRAPQGSQNVAYESELHSLIRASQGIVAVFKISVTHKVPNDEGQIYVGVRSSVLLDGLKIYEPTKAEKAMIELPKNLGWVEDPDTADWDAISKGSIAGNEPTKKMRKRSWIGYFAVLQPEDSAIALDVLISIDSDVRTFDERN